MNRPTYAKVAALLRYEPRTGKMFWRESRGRVRAGQRAGVLSSNTYWHIKIDGVTYSLPRIAWLLMTKRHPRGIVDFRNGNPSDTRWSNLVLTNPSGKIRYGKVRTNNKVGVSGVSFDPLRRRWRARAVIDGMELHLGSFDSLAEAASARFRAVPQRDKGTRCAGSGQHQTLVRPRW